jgi:hypothetical protein
MMITHDGQLFWKKISITEGEQICSKNQECKRFYNLFKQQLGHATGEPFFILDGVKPTPLGPGYKPLSF